MTLDELLDAWRVNNALNLELLDLIEDDWMDLKPGSGKTIRSNFTHLVSVRKMWAEEKLAKDSAAIPKLDWKTASKSEIREGLRQTSDLMIELLKRRVASTKPSKWSLPLFFAYCIAHEAHHRSQIEIALRIGGHEPEDKVLYGLWEWDKKQISS
ncbi:MAG: DinB family protein [Fimbriimonadaceae bacterium]|nr:DinB family protein [Fimbriimonadaceae bacterium]